LHWGDWPFVGRNLDDGHNRVVLVIGTIKLARNDVYSDVVISRRCWILDKLGRVHISRFPFRTTIVGLALKLDVNFGLFVAAEMRVRLAVIRLYKRKRSGAVLGVKPSHIAEDLTREVDDVDEDPLLVAWSCCANTEDGDDVVLPHRDGDR